MPELKGRTLRVADPLAEDPRRTNGSIAIARDIETRTKETAFAHFEATSTTSVAVDHLHALGSCRGALTVSRVGLTFTPDEKSGKHMFVLAPTDFLPSLNTDSLTIKSKDKTFRFRPADRHQGTASLQRLIDQLARR